MSSWRGRPPIGGVDCRLQDTHRSADDRLQAARPWRVGSGAAVLLAVAALAAMLSAGGCGEKSLPAATRPMDLSTASAGVSGSSASNPATAKESEKSGGAAAPVATVRRQPLRDITFDTVKLNLKKGDPFQSSLLTPAVKRLDGNRIRIRGFILPPPAETGLTRFVLVRDNMACCFGPGAALYDAMIIQMKPGLSTDYTVQPIMVEGTFNIHEVRTPDGRTLSIYHVTADKAE